MVPRDVVGHRRDVVHPVGDGDVLVVVEVLAELLEAASAGSRCRESASTHALAVEREHQAQRGVRGRVLRAEVERPQVVLRCGRAPARVSVATRLAFGWLGWRTGEQRSDGECLRARSRSSTGKLCRSPRPCSG